MSIKKYFRMINFIVGITLVFGFNACDNVNGSGNSVDSSAWILVKAKYYTISNGIAVDVDYEYDVNWINYANNNFECQYEITRLYNDYTEYTGYTYSRTGSSINIINDYINGNTRKYVNRQIIKYTTINENINPLIEKIVTEYTSDVTETQLIVYDEDINLMLSNFVTFSGIQNGNPVDLYSETNYIIELLNTTADGTKTYKYYNSSTGGAGLYQVYKIKNRIILEVNYYTADNILYSTLTYIFPENQIIRTKLPTFTIISESNTCEVLSDSPTELTVRVKAFNSGILMAQSDQTFRKQN